MELPTQDRQPAMTLVGHVLALYGSLALAALLIAASRGDVDLYQNSSAIFRLSILWGPVIGVLVGLLLVYLSRLSLNYFRWSRQLHREFRLILGDQSHRELFLLALASSIGEELLFRGALYPWLGLWPQALLFAALHIGPGKRFIPWTLMALCIGLLFGLLVQFTGDIGAAITAHFTINYLNLRFIVGHSLPDEPEAQEL